MLFEISPAVPELRFAVLGIAERESRAGLDAGDAQIEDERQERMIIRGRHELDRPLVSEVADGGDDSAQDGLLDVKELILIPARGRERVEAGAQGLSLEEVGPLRGRRKLSKNLVVFGC